MIGGMYIGDINTIFGSYQNVPAQEKERVKTELMRIYDEMKAVNANIQPVDWNK